MVCILSLSEELMFTRTLGLCNNIKESKNISLMNLCWVELLELVV